MHEHGDAEAQRAARRNASGTRRAGRLCSTGRQLSCFWWYLVLCVLFWSLRPMVLCSSRATAALSAPMPCCFLTAVSICLEATPPMRALPNPPCFIVWRQPRAGFLLVARFLACRPAAVRAGRFAGGPKVGANRGWLRVSSFIFPATTRPPNEARGNARSTAEKRGDTIKSPPHDSPARRSIWAMCSWLFLAVVSR